MSSKFRPYVTVFISSLLLALLAAGLAFSIGALGHPGLNCPGDAPCVELVCGDDQPFSHEEVQTVLPIEAGSPHTPPLVDEAYPADDFSSGVFRPPTFS